MLFSADTHGTATHILAFWNYENFGKEINLNYTQQNMYRKILVIIQFNLFDTYLCVGKESKEQLQFLN